MHPEKQHSLRHMNPPCCHLRARHFSHIAKQGLEHGKARDGISVLWVCQVVSVGLPPCLSLYRTASSHVHFHHSSYHCIGHLRREGHLPPRRLHPYAIPFLDPSRLRIPRVDQDKGLGLQLQETGYV